MYVSFPFVGMERTSTSALKAQVYCQKQHHNEGKLAVASFPYNTSTSALSKTTFHCEGNIVHASNPFIVKEFARTCPFPTTTLHHEEKHNNNCIANNYIAS
jgi:hypothetical protein